MDLFPSPEADRIFSDAAAAVVKRAACEGFPPKRRKNSGRQIRDPIENMRAGDVRRLTDGEMSAGTVREMTEVPSATEPIGKRT